jgi:hypothetical protein
MPTHKKCNTSSFFDAKIGVRDQKCNKCQNRGAKIFDFKIGRSKLQILENRGTETTIKPKYFYNE